MLGRTIADPLGIEGPAGHIDGLGLLDLATCLSPVKALRQVRGTALGAAFVGYEMHMGETDGPDTARPLVMFGDGRADGAISADGLVMGSYVHGILSEPGFRRALLARIGVAGSGRDYRADVDAALDAIAADLETHVDINGLLALAGIAA
jgi:adenosylcobyric acid synthase